MRRPRPTVTIMAITTMAITTMAIMTMGIMSTPMATPGAAPSRMCMDPVADMITPMMKMGTMTMRTMTMPIMAIPTAQSLMAIPMPPMASRATSMVPAVSITTMTITTTITTPMAMPATSMADTSADDPTFPRPRATREGADAGGEDTAGAVASLSLLPLFAWLTPSFPVGAYAYSHALEWAVEAGDIRDEQSLGTFLGDLLSLGFGRTDAILAAHAHRAAAAGNGAELADVNALAVALAPSGELRLETCQQGRSFLDAVRAAWPAPGLDEAATELAGEVAYPVAVGLAAGVHGLPLAPMLEAFLLATVQNLVSAAVRLAPIGQTAGTRVVARLAPTVHALAVEVPTLTLDDIGSATFRADLGSFRHETQYTRLFRS